MVRWKAREGDVKGAQNIILDTVAGGMLPCRQSWILYLLYSKESLAEEQIFLKSVVDTWIEAKRSAFSLKHLKVLTDGQAKLTGDFWDGVVCRKRFTAKQQDTS
jgi:hypothetical protein